MLVLMRLRISVSYLASIFEARKPSLKTCSMTKSSGMKRTTPTPASCSLDALSMNILHGVPSRLLCLESSGFPEKIDEKILLELDLLWLFGTCIPLRLAY